MTISRATSLILGILTAVLVGTVHAQTMTWTGGTDAYWSTPANWNENVPGDTDVGLFNLDGTYTNQPTLSATAAVGGLWSTSSGMVAIGGSPLTLNGASINGNAATGIEMDPGSGGLSVSTPLLLGGPQSWLNNSTNLLTVSGDIDNGGNVLTVAGTGNVSVSGILSGASGLTKSDSGTGTLAAANTYTGITAVNGGTLRIANGGQVYSNLNNDMANAVSISSGGMLEFENYAWQGSFGQLWDTSTNILVDGGTLRYIGSGDNSGGHSLTIGANGATLDAASSGQLWTIANGDVHSLASDNGGMLTLTGVGNGQIDQIIPGSGGLTKTGSGTWALTVANTYTGTTTVNGGTLRIVNGGQMYSNLNNNLANAITVSSGGTLEFDNYAWQGCFGQLWDASANIVVDGGTLRYIGSGDNSGGHSLTIGANGATLDAASSGQLWTIANGDVHSLASDNGGMLTLTGVGNGQIDQSIPGSGGLTMNGPGRWTLTNVNTFTGDTTVNGGTLNLASWATLASNLIINNGGTVYVTHSQGLYADAAHAKTVTINAGGLLDLATPAADISVIVLSGGTLAGTGDPFWGSWWLNNNITANGGTVSTISASGMNLPSTQTFTVEDSSTLNVTGTLINVPGYGSGGIIKAGPGTMVLSNVNSFTGDTTVTGGTLDLASYATLASNLIINNGGTVYVTHSQGLYADAAHAKTVTINAGGLLDLATPAADIGVIVLSGGTLAGTGDPFWGSWWLNNSITANGGTVSTISASGMNLPGTHTFTVEDSSTLNVTGTLINVPGYGSGGIIKAGRGTMVLGNANTYSGGTTVEAGMLILASSNAILDGTSLTVGADAMSIFGTTVLGAQAASTSIAVLPVPEPGTFALCVAGFVVGLGVWHRRKGFVAAD